MTERIFDQSNQRFFADLTGDYNPIHISDVLARRMLFGRQIVHGIHLIFWSLEEWQNIHAKNYKIITLQANFIKPVFLGDKVKLNIVENNNEIKFEISGDSRQFATINLVVEFQHPPNNYNSFNSAEWNNEPVELSGADLVNHKGHLTASINVDRLRTGFPLTYQKSDIGQIAFLASTTRLIGMNCPGLHSIYSNLKIDFTKQNSEREYEYFVKKFDSRFKRVEIEIGSGLAKILSFLRPGIRVQEPFSRIKSKITPNEFVRMNALVVGGTRGLGEVTVKLLAAGNANVHFTYFKGRDDAARIANEIRKANQKINEPIMLDVVSMGAEGLSLLLKEKEITHLFYFATPFIFSGQRDNFDYKLFDTFCCYYLGGLLKIISALRDTLTHIFIPSTDALNHLQKNMVEYTAAKSAAEIYSKSIESSGNIKIMYPRLPRIDTDQTNSLLPVENEDPSPQMIKYIRLLSSL
jgi:acyl dehydratase